MLTFLVQLVPDRARAVADWPPCCRCPSRSAAPPSPSSARRHEIAETLRERRERFGFSYIVVHEAEFEAFAPVVAELAGT